VPEFQELHADTIASLSRYMSVAVRLRCETAELVAATRETMAQSRALIADVDAVLTKITSPTRNLWPTY
jgi:hypothetical protein